MSENKLEFIIKKDSEGNDVEFDNLSPEATDALILLLQSMKDIMSNTPGAEELKIQLVKGSVGIQTIGPPDVIQNFQDDFIKVLDRIETNSDIVNPWRQVQSLFQNNGLEYDANFFSQSKKYSIKKDIKTAKEFRAKPIRQPSSYSLLFVKGKLIEVGGKNPNIHIQDLKPIRCTEEEAIKVNKFLYQNVEVLVRRRYTKNIEEFTFCNFFLNEAHKEYFKRILHNLNSCSLEDFIFKLHFEIKDVLDKGDFGVLKKMFRLFDHVSTDVNILKTILIITKSFSDNPEIKEERAKFVHTLRSKLEVEA